ncbi:hypothetical protein B0A48_10673 [Cryoendolithus antarcticus]|uniref:Uncharacterized protein n=1 Tax=Cryoendolithus antarcticus TaxID=1507870 RepID=A0A1V8SY77_9PEZI|nr:hypothetical protein B0A48_10673 [Cryoendolithus antarcticus]
MAPYLDSDSDAINDIEYVAHITALTAQKNGIDVDTTKDTPQSKSGLLQASPYTTREHLLDLSTLAPPLQLFAKSLLHMQALRSDYATAPYSQAFNWQSIVDAYSDVATDNKVQLRLEPLHYFVVVFRSRINLDADRILLGQLDAAAHVEAVDGGGLLKYWFGTPDASGRNLATCIWRNREDARRGGGGPGHIGAMMAARRMYNEWFVERLKLSVDPRARSWSFSVWEGTLDGPT